LPGSTITKQARIEATVLNSLLPISKAAPLPYIDDIRQVFYHLAQILYNSGQMSLKAVILSV
jgi:hypothetical protein